jgi:hypothetical protein
MYGSAPNPSVSALVVAIGQQLDVIDAAVHALQVLLSTLVPAIHAWQARDAPVIFVL